MILYTNGCSHVAGAEALNTYCFAEDDSQYFYLKRKPHPANLAVSFSAILAKLLQARLYCDAESAASNDRIVRTTRDFIKGQYKENVKEDVFVLIGWTTWEREEWEHEGEYYQVNSSGLDALPEPLQLKYKHWIVEKASNWPAHQQKWHRQVWDLHCELQEQNIKHLFFNSHIAFSLIQEQDQKDWGDSYVDPYSESQSFFNLLNTKGFKVRPSVAADMGGGHYLADGHQTWAHHLLPHLTKALSGPII
jgi:hypothetical protein